MFKKLNILRKKNLKYTIQSIERYFKINFYSNYGKDKFFFKFLYIFFFIAKSFALFKKNYSKIFKNKKKNSNIICIIPRSGNNLIRCIFSSYYELAFNIGDGIPKYNCLTDKWSFNFDINNSLELYNATFEDKKIFNPYDLAFTQFPIHKVNLTDIKNTKPVIVIRDPKNIISSWYLHDKKNSQMNQNNFDNLLFEKRIKNVNYAFAYWEKFISGKKNNKDFLLIKFEELIENTEDTILSIFSFFNIKVNREILKKSININSKENHKKYMSNNIENSVRFSNPNINYKEFIQKKINNQIKTSLY